MNKEEPKFTFTYKSLDGKVLTMSTNSVTWPELTQDFLDFLRGCGFQISANTEVVEPEPSNE